MHGLRLPFRFKCRTSVEDRAVSFRKRADDDGDDEKVINYLLDGQVPGNKFTNNNSNVRRQGKI